MARTALTLTVAPGPNPTAGVVLTLSAGDASNNNQFPFTADQLLLVLNTDTDPGSITLTSSADDSGRTGDVTDAIPAGDMYVYGPFADKTGWVQSGNLFFLSPEAATVEIAVVKLPGF